MICATDSPLAFALEVDAILVEWASFTSSQNLAVNL
jgi:hypothetical protein